MIWYDMIRWGKTIYGIICDMWYYIVRYDMMRCDESHETAHTSRIDTPNHPLSRHHTRNQSIYISLLLNARRHSHYVTITMLKWLKRCAGWHCSCIFILLITALSLSFFSIPVLPFLSLTLLLLLIFPSTPFCPLSLLFSSLSLHPLHLSFTSPLTTSSTFHPTILTPSIPSVNPPFLSLFSPFLTLHPFLPHSTLLHIHAHILPISLYSSFPSLPPSHSSSLCISILLSHSIPIDRILTLK